MQRRKRIAQVSHLTSLEEIESCVGKLFFGGENEGKNGRLGRLAYPLNSPVPVIPVHPPHRSHEGRSLQLLVPGPSSQRSSDCSGHRMFLLIQMPAMSFPKRKTTTETKMMIIYYYYHSSYSFQYIYIYKHPQKIMKNDDFFLGGDRKIEASCPL